MSLEVLEKRTVEEMEVAVTLRFVNGVPDNELTKVLAEFLPDEVEEDKEEDLSYQG